MANADTQDEPVSIEEQIASVIDAQEQEDEPTEEDTTDTEEQSDDVEDESSEQEDAGDVDDDEESTGDSTESDGDGEVGDSAGDEDSDLDWDSADEETERESNKLEPPEKAGDNRMDCRETDRSLSWSTKWQMQTLKTSQSA